MEKLRILHTADLHITDDSGAKVFAKIVDLASKEKVDVLLIAGDLFDSAVASGSDKSYITALFDKIPSIKVFLVAGNHDPLPTYKDVEFPGNVYLFGHETEKFELEHVDIYGASFYENHQSTALVENFVLDNPEKINILLMHGDLGQVSKYNPFNIQQLEKTGVDYAALGHVHAHGGIQKAGNTFYAYAGIPQGRGYDEIGKKGIILGNVFKGYVDLEFVPMSDMEFCEIKVDVSNCQDYNEICDIIRKSASELKHAYKIVLVGCFDGEFEIRIDLIRNILSEYENIKIVDATTIALNLEEISGEYSLRGLFVKKCLEKGLDKRIINCGLAALDGKKVALW